MKRLCLNILVVVVSIFFMVTIEGCLNNSKTIKRNSESDSTDSISMHNLSGVYRGKLPCVNCDRIETVLFLSEDFKFKLNYTYIGKSDQWFEHSGKWKVQEGNLILEGIDYSYKVRDNKLQQLDLFGEEIKGEIASRYMLEKLSYKE